MSTWYEQAIFYHMYPLGITGAPKINVQTEVTDRFKELDQWIPHIRSLGCNAIYIGPLFESSSHGYDTRDYKLVDRRLGTNDDFREFTKLCHENGIKVVVDGVFNHTGREFFAFKDIQEKKWDSPYKDWYKGVNFGWQSPLGDPFGYEAWQGHFELPCLNLYNQQVKDYLFDVIRFWVDEFDIDGIRLDCANILDFNFMKEMRAKTASMKPDFWLMGECSRSKFLTKLLKTFDKTFREIFPVFISTKRREKPSAFFDNNFVNNAYFSEAASSSSSHLASSSSKAPISSRMTCLCLWSS